MIQASPPWSTGTAWRWLAASLHSHRKGKNEEDTKRKCLSRDCEHEFEIIMMRFNQKRERREREREREREEKERGGGDSTYTVPLLIETTDLQHPCLPIDIRGVCSFGTCIMNNFTVAQRFCGSVMTGHYIEIHAMSPNMHAHSQHKCLPKDIIIHSACWLDTYTTNSEVASKVLWFWSLLTYWNSQN